MMIGDFIQSKYLRGTARVHYGGKKNIFFLLRFQSLKKILDFQFIFLL